MYDDKWVAGKFKKHHILIVNQDIRSKDGFQQCKKKAEQLFQSRGVSVNTVICLSSSQWRSLQEEVRSRQEEYARRSKPFKSRRKYHYFERGGTQRKDRMRAEHKGEAYISYDVRKDGDCYQIYHLDRMIN